MENGKFGNYENIKYFGINEQTEEQVRNQVKVLYYESKDNFAIKLTTQGNDEIILSKENKEDNFLGIYKEIEKREFYIDDTFTIFLQEEGKDLPYFAARISNIKNVQKD